MSKTLAVAARELRERWLLFPAGLALGFVPLALPAFVPLPADGAPLVGLVVALLLGTIAALVAGSGMLARDAVDGRLGFLFSRPVPWPAIWGGKWLAAIVLVTGSGALAALPWMAVYPPGNHRSWGAALLDAPGSVFFVLLLLTGIGLANLSATAVRSRSAWLALDLGLLLLALWTIRRWVAPLYGLGILEAAWGFLLLAPLALALVVASAVQVAVGRTDIRRAHRGMSSAFWCVLFLSLAAAGLRLSWAGAAGPADVAVMVGSHDPEGRWLFAEGPSRRGGWVDLLVDTEHARFVSFGLTRPWWALGDAVAFSADGRWGARLVPDGDGSGLVVADLSADEPRFSRVRLESSPPPSPGSRFALSSAGSTALLVHEHGASLYARSSGRRAATVTLPPGWRAAAVRFLEETKARVWLIPAMSPRPSTSPAEMRLLEIAVDREARTTPVLLVSTAEDVPVWSSFVIADAAGRHFLTGGGGLRLYDGETGGLLATLVEGPAPFSATFLADGRIVVGESAGTHTVLRFFAADGSPQGELDVEHASAGLAVGPEVSPGRVAVSFSWARETLIVDVARRGVVETLPNERPLRGFWVLRGTQTPRGAPSTVQFFEGDEGTIVRRNFATGERRVVAGPGAPPGERLRSSEVGLGR